MKTSTIITMVLIGILAFSLAACSKSEAPTPLISERTESLKPPKHQQPALPPLDQEAVALAEKAFSERWTQVGDSCFTLIQERETTLFSASTKFIQIRGATHTITPSGLSEAETLNGLQWRGLITFSNRLNRKYNPETRKWSDWSDGPPAISFSLDYNLTKQKGQWTSHVKQAFGQHLYTITKPSEEQIKNILTQ